MSVSSLRAFGLFGVPIALLPLTPERPIVAALVIAAYGALLAVVGNLMRPARSALAYACTAAVYLCVALIAAQPTSDYGMQKVFFVVLVVFPFAVIVSSLIRKPDDVRHVLLGALTLGVIVAAGSSLTLNRELLGADRYQWLGNLSAFAAVISLHGWVVRRKIVNGAALVFTVAGIAVAAAKQSLALIAVGWIIILLSRLNNGRRALYYVLFSVLAIGTLATQVDRIVNLPIAATMVQRLGVLAPSSGGFTLLQRGLLYRKALTCYAANPVVGIGIGHYEKFPGYTAAIAGDTHEYPHSVFLEVLCEQGTVGFIVLFLPLVVAGLNMFRRSSQAGGEPYLGALLLAALAATTAGLTGDLMSRPVWVYGILMVRLTMLQRGTSTSADTDDRP